MRFGIVIALLLCTTSYGDGNWPMWRGPSKDGRAHKSASPPIEWSEENNVLWKAAIPGLGTSTPSVWDDQIILTSALNTGRTVEVKASGDDKKPPPNEVYELLVMAFDRTSGQMLWKTTLAEVVPHERHHETGSYASASTITDGERIYAFFGSLGLFALDMDGNTLWEKEFPRMETLAEFGEGASPALGNGVLVVAWDEQGPSFVMGIDATSGQELWKTPRDTDTAWTTPLIQRDGDSFVAIVSGSDETSAYDISTGEERWVCGEMSKNPVSSPVATDGVVYIGNSYQGNVLQAIRFVGAEGDVTENPEHLLWTYRKAASYVPTPVLLSDRIFFLRDSGGAADCLDARTGEVVLKAKRLGIKRLHASPIVADDRIYITSRDGETVVIDAGNDFQILSRNQLADVFDASPVAVGSALILRGRENLYCLGE